MKEIWNIQTARGVGLDIWGRIVGVTRVLQVSSGIYSASPRPTVNRHGNGTPYRRPKGTPLVANWMRPMVFLCSAEEGRFFAPG